MLDLLSDSRSVRRALDTTRSATRLERVLLCPVRPTATANRGVEVADERPGVMMATENESRHEALLELHEAACALERGDVREAERHCLCSVAWMRELPSVEPVQAQG